MNDHISATRGPNVTFEVYIRQGRGWAIQDWTLDQWHEWLRSSTPAAIAREMLSWAALLQRLPERRMALEIAIEGARRHMRATETTPA